MTREEIKRETYYLHQKMGHAAVLWGKGHELSVIAKRVGMSEAWVMRTILRRRNKRRAYRKCGV